MGLGGRFVIGKNKQIICYGIKMTNYKCLSCGYEGWVKWHVQGDKTNLKELTLKFNCSKCGFPMELIVVFPEDKGKPKISIESANYIG